MLYLPNMNVIFAVYLEVVIVSCLWLTIVKLSDSCWDEALSKCSLLPVSYKLRGGITASFYLTTDDTHLSKVTADRIHIRAGRDKQSSDLTKHRLIVTLRPGHLMKRKPAVLHTQNITTLFMWSEQLLIHHYSVTRLPHEAHMCGAACTKYHQLIHVIWPTTEPSSICDQATSWRASLRWCTHKISQIYIWMI